MKLATSTNIMDFDDKRPYQIPIDVSTRACAKAGYKYVDACLCSHCREGQPLRGENWEKWIADTAALAEELGVKYIQAHAYWTIGNAFNADLTRSDGKLTRDVAVKVVVSAGCYKGKTLGRIAMEKPGSLQWYVDSYKGPDNLLRAAAKYLMDQALAPAC